MIPPNVEKIMTNERYKPYIFFSFKSFETYKLKNPKRINQYILPEVITRNKYWIGSSSLKIKF